MQVRLCVSLISLALAGAGCFVSEGNCVQRGVSVTPCTVQLRPGQTAVLTARIPGAPHEPVDWIVPESALGAFALHAEDNVLTLVSKLNVPANFPVQASSQTEPTFFGGAVVGVSSATFGSQPPPFFFFGGGLPVGSKAAATAVGGNLYFVAFADAQAPLQAGESTNRFLKRYSLATNQLSADVPGQFELFVGPDSPIVPNVAADCAGNAYWIDLITAPDGYVLRRLLAGSNTVEEQRFEILGEPQFEFISIRSLAVSCEGQIYFIGDEPFQRSLWRLSSFQAQPEPIEVPEIDDFPFLFDVFAIDELGRVLAGSSSFVEQPLVRLTLSLQSPAGGTGLQGSSWLGEVDPTFTVDEGLGGVGSIALDRKGAVYVSLSPSGGSTLGLIGFDALAALNSLGATVYQLDRYTYQCPSACVVPECGTSIPFNDIQWIGASADGRLRVIERPLLDDSLPAECQESVRLILLDPN